LVPEMNNGQLVKLLRAEYLIAAEPLGKVTGKPFRVTEIVQQIRKLMGGDAVQS
jgi:2-oxoglutarate ferredoxin oxidoreductase subunit alpha